MTIWDHFIRFRADLPFWVWPLLLFELWAVKAWALEEAEKRGLDQIAFIISVDDWGRVHVHFVTEDVPSQNPLENLTPFALPASLELDPDQPARERCKAGMTIIRKNARRPLPLRVPCVLPARLDTS